MKHALSCLRLLALLLVLLPLTTRATNTVLTVQALGSATAPTDDVTMFVDQVEIVQVPVGAVVGGTPLNASFETVGSIFVNFAYAPAGASWTFNSRSGISENGGAFGAAPAPNGTRMAFLQSQGGINGLLEQTLPLGVGSYQVRFRMSQRNFGSSRNQRLSVRIDGVEVGVATTANFTGYDTFTSASFTVVAPTIASFSPASGAQGSLVTVTGTNLTTIRSVRFGELPAAFVVNSATQLTATVPRGASTHRLRVSTPGGPALSATAFGVSKFDSYNFPLVTASFNGLDVGDDSKPAFADLDGDGLLDMLVGKQNGSLSHYEQTATNATTFAQVTASFNGIALNSSAAPALTDLDGDGRLDLLVGNFDGTLYHYKQAAPNATAFTLVTASLDGIDVGLFSAPTFTDLDGDGRLDLLVGNIDGNLHHYEQAATVGAAFTLVTASFNGIGVSTFAAPAVADLDGDGLLDLLAGDTGGGLSHYEQTAANATAFTLVTASFSGLDVGIRSTPAFTDLDGDGLLDLLVGKSDGTLSHYEQAAPPPTIASFSPASGPQGSTLTVTGTRLSGTTSVRFGELPAAFVVNSATQLSVTVPRGASTHKLRLTTPGGGTALTASAFGVSKFDSYVFPVVTASFNGLDVGDISAPAFADLDGDGLLDMLVGKQDGFLSHYEQTATNSTTFTPVTAGFSGITVGQFSAPALTDLDGDGRLDLLVGNFDGVLHHYEQAAASSLSFALVTASFNGLDVNFLSKPAFTDLDGDGLLDLLVGNVDGVLSHYEQAAANATSFALVTASFNGIAVGSLAAPTFADLDGDGLLDLLVGRNDGTLSHYEQTAANVPTFALVTATFNTLDVGTNSAPTFTDLDGDGLLDMLVGKNDGTLSHYEQEQPMPPTITSFNPASGPQGSTLTVTGTGLLGTTSVRFGELPAAFVVNSATQLSVTVPRGASTHQLRVTTPIGTVLSATAFGVSKFDTYVFPLVTTSLNTIDVGDNSRPAIADLDGDGLLDMLVGKGGSTLSHYEQTAANAPTFALVTASFNGISVSN